MKKKTNLQQKNLAITNFNVKIYEIKNILKFKIFENS